MRNQHQQQCPSTTAVEVDGAVGEGADPQLAGCGSRKVVTRDNTEALDAFSPGRFGLHLPLECTNRKEQARYPETLSTSSGFCQHKASRRAGGTGGGGCLYS